MVGSRNSTSDEVTSCRPENDCASHSVPCFVKQPRVIKDLRVKLGVHASAIETPMVLRIKRMLDLGLGNRNKEPITLSLYIKTLSYCLLHYLGHQRIKGIVKCFDLHTHLSHEWLPSSASILAKDELLCTCLRTKAGQQSTFACIENL